MKANSNLLSKITLAAAIVFSITLISSCSKKDDTPTQQQVYAISGNASGSQESPPVSGSGSGTITGTYNPNNNQFIYTTTWAGLTTAPLTGGIYAGATGVNGTVVGEAWSIPAGASTSGSVTDTLTLTSDQANQLTTGNWYYTYFTLANPTGEIRGQIIATR